MRGGIILALSVLMITAGCIGSDDAQSQDLDSQSVDVADQEAETSEVNNTTEAEIYSYADLVVGASPPNPAGDGPALEQLPLAHSETFEVTEDALALAFEATDLSGTGAAKVEVLDPDGEIVYQSNRYILVGAPGGPSVGLYNPTEASDGDDPAPGTYTANYYVAGAYQVGLTVTAELPAAAAS